MHGYTTIASGIGVGYSPDSGRPRLVGQSSLTVSLKGRDALLARRGTPEGGSICLLKTDFAENWRKVDRTKGDCYEETLSRTVRQIWKPPALPGFSEESLQNSPR